MNNQFEFLVLWEFATPSLLKVDVYSFFQKSTLEAKTFNYCRIFYYWVCFHWPFVKD